MPEILTTPNASETRVFVRTVALQTVAQEVGPLATTVLDNKPDTILFSDTANCCEDCPDINVDPPNESDCPNFEHEVGKWPVCKREGNSDEQIGKFFFGQ
jgi:hypothetical protein